MNAHQTPPSLFSTLAGQLVANGYRPVPGYQDTKRPSINGWNQFCDRQWHPDELTDVMAHRGQQEGKMVCLAIQKELVAIDLDIDDQDLSDFVDHIAVKHFGKTPLIRVGRHPRMVLIYRNAGDIRSRKYHPIEIFAGSGQIVGFGYHLGAKRDYLWPNQSPLDLPANDPSIPIISQQQLDAFLDDCRARVTFKTSAASEYIDALYMGDTLVKDRNDALTQINAKAEQLANAPEGQRNELLFHVAYVSGQAIAAGLVQREEVEATLLNAASTCGLMTEQDGNRGVRATLRSGFEKGAKAPFFVISNWFEKPEEETIPFVETPNGIAGIKFDEDKPFSFPPSLIKGVLPKTGVAFLGGQSGAGKTFLAVDLAVALTTQQSFFGRRVREKVGVIILAGEGAETLQPRIKVARMARNVEGNLPIAWMDNVPNLADQNAAKVILPQLKALDSHFREHHGVRLGVIIFDTLAATFLLQDENDNSEASKVIKVLQNISATTNALCIPVHHYGKGAETGLRGASAWRAGSDAVLSVTADRNQLTGLVTNHSLWLAKSRVGEEGPLGEFDLNTMFVGLDEDDEELTSCYVVPKIVRQTTLAERKQSEELLMEMVDAGEWREDPRSEQWVGNAVAEAYGLDLTEKGHVVRAKALIKRLLEDKKLVAEVRMDEWRKLKKYIRTSAAVRAAVQKKDISSDEISLFD